jgi:phosphomannomutase
MNKPMVSVSGIRGLVNDSFSEELIRVWSRAFGFFCLANIKISPTDYSIVIGRDTRQSGTWAEKIIAEELLKFNIQPIFLGIVPTPTVELAVTHHHANGGIIITASHNPIEWNGLKFLGSDGVFLNANEIEILKQLLLNKKPELSSKQQVSTLQDTEAIARHIEKILSTLPINVEIIRAKKFKVVLDPVNGAGALAVPLLLEKLGCEIITVHGEPTGIFGHNPEPRPENLTDLSNKVKEIGAVIGFAVDPDADRLALIDETGVAISEEYTLAIAVLSAMRNFSNSNTILKNNIVVNLSTSRMIDDVAKLFNAKVIRSAVGEINVVKSMRENKAYIGGEGNGGVIFPSCHEGRDSLVGIAMILDLLANKKEKLSEIVDSLPKYNMTKDKFPRPENFDVEKLKLIMEKDFPDTVFSTIDGLRMDTDNGWTHIRPSNTEPIIRIITEAKTENDYQSLFSTAKKALEQLK